MPKLPGNEVLRSVRGEILGGLLDINGLLEEEKFHIYTSVIPHRLFHFLNISPETGCGIDGQRRITIIAPEGFALARIEVRYKPDDRRTVFFLDITETHFHQMELSLCIINDPFFPYFAVDVNENGNNYFATLGRNIPEEIRAMQAGLYPHQTSNGLRMFGDFLTLFERFVDSLNMDMIIAEPLTYDNAIRYEKYGFDYLNGRRMMQEINREFRYGGALFRLLNSSTPFRKQGMDATVHGRSWAIHDGILDELQNDDSVDAIFGEPWDDIKIYKTIGVHAGVETFRNISGSVAVST